MASKRFVPARGQRLAYGLVAPRTFPWAMQTKAKSTGGSGRIYRRPDQVHGLDQLSVPL